MLALICAAIEDPDDREFMTQFYLEYERLMYATARKNLSDPESIKDIVQESVLKLIPKTSFLRQQENCIKASYVVSTVRNTAINHLRKQGRVTGKCSNLEDEDVVMPGPSLDDHLLQTERLERLAEVWDLLPEDDQLLLEGKYILGQEDTELADMLGCKASSIRMKLTRARRRAFQLMNEEADHSL